MRAKRAWADASEIARSDRRSSRRSRSSLHTHCAASSPSWRRRARQAGR